jgi:hypothetical protein
MKAGYGPLNKMHSAIQLAAFHYIVCLKTKPSNADHKISVYDFEFHFESIRTVDSTWLHAEFQRWAASAVLRDLIEHFSIFLLEIYQDAVTSSPSRTFSVTPTQFERRGIEDQLATLSTEFSISREWTSRLTGYNRARKCFAHRAGIVGPPDATDASDLVIRWLAAKATLTQGSHNQFVDVQGPMGDLVRAEHIAGLSSANIELQDREKRVPIGSILHFRPDEVFEICQTFQLAATAFSGVGFPQDASAGFTASDGT